MSARSDAGTVEVRLSDAERSTLHRWAHSDDESLARRAKIVLAVADGHSRAQVARDLEVSPPTAAKWWRRFLEDGLAGVEKIRPGRGRRPSIPPQTVRLILEGVRDPPPHGKPRWTVRDMAERAGVSRDTVQRLWRAAQGPTLVHTPATTWCDRTMRHRGALPDLDDVGA